MLSGTLGMSPKPTSEALYQQYAQLAKRLKKRDASVFPELYEALSERLFAFFFYQTGSSEIAEELTQDTFIKIFSKIDQLDDPKKFFGWIMTIARNEFKMMIEKAETRVKDLTIKEKEGDESMLDSLPNSLDRESLQTLLEVRETLTKLDAEDRELILLADHQGLSYEEIAETLGVSVSATRSRLHRARDEFKKHYMGDKK